MDRPRIPEDPPERAYYLPGMEGVLLDAMIVELIASDAPSGLRIEKHRTPDGKWMFIFHVLEEKDLTR